MITTFVGRLGLYLFAIALWVKRGEADTFRVLDGISGITRRLILTSKGRK